MRLVTSHFHRFYPFLLVGLENESCQCCCLRPVMTASTKQKRAREMRSSHVIEPEPPRVLPLFGVLPSIHPTGIAIVIQIMGMYPIAPRAALLKRDKDTADACTHACTHACIHACTPLPLSLPHSMMNKAKRRGRASLQLTDQFTNVQRSSRVSIRHGPRLGRSSQAGGVHSPNASG